MFCVALVLDGPAARQIIGHSCIHSFFSTALFEKIKVIILTVTMQNLEPKGKAIKSYTEDLENWRFHVVQESNNI